MSTMKKILTENWKFIVCVLLISAILFPMIYTIFYTLPSADDFSMAYGCSRKTILADSISHANRRYINQSGLWIYMFAETILNPIVYFELESFGIGIEMILLFMAFIISLCTLINTVVKRVLGIENREVAAASIALFLFVFLNTNIYKEVFYWFVGSSYMMAMTMGLITINLTIRYFFKNGINRGGGILLSLTGALACNFFQEAILPGTVYLVLWCYFSYKEGRLLWKKAIPFIPMFLSGLIAVAAPGNFERHTDYADSFNIFQAFIDAAKMTLIILKHLVQQPLVIVLLVGCIYLGFKCEKRQVKGSVVLLAGVLALGTLAINAFPVALGYAGTEMPNRVYFFLDFTALAGMAAFFIFCGIYAKNLEWCQSFQPYHIEVLMAGFVILLLYSTLVYNQNISKLPWSRTVAGIKEVKETHDFWQEELIAIRDSGEKNLVIEVEPKYMQSDILSLPRLTGNVENWVNVRIAKFYDKETVKVEEKEQED